MSGLDPNRTFTDAAGAIWPDPYGVAAPPASAPPGPVAPPVGPGMSSDPSTVAAFQAATAPAPAPPPEAHAPPGLPSREEDLTDQLNQGATLPPTPKPGFADQAAAGGAGAPPAPQPGIADTLDSSSSSSGSEHGSTGLSAEAQQRQGQNISQVAGGLAGARDATAQYGQLQAQQAEQRSAVLLKEASEGIEKTAAQIALQDEIQRRVDTRMQAGAAWKPDRAELFHGDSGASFGIMAAVAAMAGAWMQGRGLTGSNPYLPTIMHMIDENVQSQVRSNSQSMQLLREQKGDIKAAIIELKQRQLHFAQLRLDGLAMKDQSDLMRAGVEKTRADMQAQDAKWEQEKRQALERTETNKVTSSFTKEVKPNPAATGERSTDQGKTQAVFDMADSFYKKAGLIRDKDGKWRVGGGAFPPAMLEKLNPFSDDAIATEAKQLAETYGRHQSGGVIGKDEAPAFEDQIGMNTTTRAQLAAHANALETSLRAGLKRSDAATHTASSTIPASWRRK